MLPDNRPSGHLELAQVHGALGTAITELVGSVARVGIDIVDIIEFAHNMNIGGTRWLARVFTTAELEFCAGRPSQLAARFAAKEAVVKVIGTGFRGVRARDIEIVTAPEGRPTVRLAGPAEAAASGAGLASIELSITREGSCAAAVAVGLRQT